MTIRTTVSFDLPTSARLDRLAALWKTSKSDALRRALEKAESLDVAQLENQIELTDEQIAAMTPQEAFQWMQQHPRVPNGWGAGLRAELAKERDRDARVEEERAAARGKARKVVRR